MAKKVSEDRFVEFLSRDSDGNLTPVGNQVEAQVTVESATIVAGAATLSNVSSSASNGTLLASNADRIGVLIVNDSTATLYLKYGATASTSSYSVKMEPGSYWEMPQPIYTGIIDGIWSSANGSARITELE